MRIAQWQLEILAKGMFNHTKTLVFNFFVSYILPIDFMLIKYICNLIFYAWLYNYGIIQKIFKKSIFFIIIIDKYKKCQDSKCDIVEEEFDSQSM
jgi:hypothetical protein